MVEIEWMSGNQRIISIYECEQISAKQIEKRYECYDRVEFWYPQKLEENIYHEWRELLSYIHFKQDWGIASVTRCISLLKADAEILQGFSKNTRYEVKRALQRDKLKSVYYQDVSDAEFSEFIIYYNQFAESKRLQPICIEKVEGMRINKNLVLTKVLSEKNEILAMHSYLYQPNERAVLLASCSLYREEHDAEKVKLIGRANRGLHYQDMLYFKELGIKIYDLGGNYTGTENEELLKITKFKEKLGGQLEYSDASITIPLKAIMGINNVLFSLYSTNKKLIVFGYNVYGQYFMRKCQQNHIEVDAVVDNYKQRNDIEPKVYAESILETFDSASTIIISFLSPSTYRKLAVQFQKWGYIDKVNIMNAREMTSE